MQLRALRSGSVSRQATTVQVVCHLDDLGNSYVEVTEELAQSILRIHYLLVSCLSGHCINVTACHRNLLVLACRHLL